MALDGPPAAWYADGALPPGAQGSGSKARRCTGSAGLAASSPYRVRYTYSNVPLGWVRSRVPLPADVHLLVATGRVLLLPAAPYPATVLDETCQPVRLHRSCQAATGSVRLLPTPSSSTCDCSLRALSTLTTVRCDAERCPSCDLSSPDVAILVCACDSTVQMCSGYPVDLSTQGRPGPPWSTDSPDRAASCQPRAHPSTTHWSPVRFQRQVLRGLTCRLACPRRITASDSPDRISARQCSRRVETHHASPARLARRDKSALYGIAPDIRLASPDPCMPWRPSRLPTSGHRPSCDQPSPRFAYQPRRHAVRAPGLSCDEPTPLWPSPSTSLRSTALPMRLPVSRLSCPDDKSHPVYAALPASDHPGPAIPHLATRQVTSSSPFAGLATSRDRSRSSR